MTCLRGKFDARIYGGLLATSRSTRNSLGFNHVFQSCSACFGLVVGGKRFLNIFSWESLYICIIHHDLLLFSLSSWLPFFVLRMQLGPLKNPFRYLCIQLCVQLGMRMHIYAQIANSTLLPQPKQDY